MKFFTDFLSDIVNDYNFVLILRELLLRYTVHLLKMDAFSGAHLSRSVVQSPIFMKLG